MQNKKTIKNKEHLYQNYVKWRKYFRSKVKWGQEDGQIWPLTGYFSIIYHTFNMDIGYSYLSCNSASFDIQQAYILKKILETVDNWIDFNGFSRNKVEKDGFVAEVS